MTLVKAAVDRLVEENQPVTVEAVCRLTQELDPKGKGVQKSGVLQNAEAHAYYRHHSATYRSYHGWKDRKPTRPPSPAEPPQVKLDRDVDRVRRRYRLFAKAELVERLVAAEQAYADAQQQVVRLQFELAESRRELQEAVVLPAQPLTKPTPSKLKSSALGVTTEGTDVSHPENRSKPEYFIERSRSMSAVEPVWCSTAKTSAPAGDRCVYVRASGRETKNVEPWPRALSAQMRPP